MNCTKGQTHAENKPTLKYCLFNVLYTNYNTTKHHNITDSHTTRVDGKLLVVPVPFILLTNPPNTTSTTTNNRATEQQQTSGEFSPRCNLNLVEVAKICDDLRQIWYAARKRKSARTKIFECGNFPAFRSGNNIKAPPPFVLPQLFFLLTVTTTCPPSR